MQPDFSAVRFIDSTGLGALVASSRRLRRAGCRLDAALRPGKTRRTLERWELASASVTGRWAADDNETDTWRVAGPYLKQFASATAKQRSRLAKKAPLAEIQGSALHHPDAFVRRACLGFLDHYANEASTVVFAEALRDPVDFVRNVALHSIACESCRTEELCVADVVQDIVAVLDGDPNPEMRTKAIPTLLRLAGRDIRAREAIERAAEHDLDAIVRRAAADALKGSFVAPRKRYERSQRRHDRRARRSAD